MSDNDVAQCCNNPTGFVREHCSELTDLVNNIVAILDAAGQGPSSGLNCESAIVCIQNSINAGEITIPSSGTVTGGSYSKVTGQLTLTLSVGPDVVIGLWPINIQPVEINSGGSYPTPVELVAEAAGKDPNTLIWFQGTEQRPEFVWSVNPDNTVTLIQGALLPELNGSAVFDPGSLADGDGEQTNVTVTGAVLGDFCTSSFSLDVAGITVTRWVSAANTVTVRFQNESGGVLDLGSGTLRARVQPQ